VLSPVASVPIVEPHPEAIRAALEQLRNTGAVLRQCPARPRLTRLASLLDGWADPNSPWRRRLLSALPATTGFAPAAVATGLELALKKWNGAALFDLVEREFADPTACDGEDTFSARGFPVTAVSLAGCLPTPTLWNLLAPLVLGSPVLVKPSRGDPITAELVAASITELDPELGNCIRIVPFPSSDAPSTHAFLSADCVVATGSDATLRAICARVTPPQRLIAYGHRLSLTVLGPQALRGEALTRTAEATAVDVALWDQLGCLSSIAVYTVGTEKEAGVFAEALAASLTAAEKRWPRGPLPDSARAAFAHERALAEMRAAADPAVQMFEDPASRWVVVCEADGRFRPAPLYRFVRVHPVHNLAALADALSPVRSHLAAIAAAGFGPDTSRATRLLGELGASRICPPGHLQAPSLGWHHDGQPVLLPLARLTDNELS